MINTGESLGDGGHGSFLQGIFEKTDKALNATRRERRLLFRLVPLILLPILEQTKATPVQPFIPSPSLCLPVSLPLPHPQPPPLPHPLLEAHIELKRRKKLFSLCPQTLRAFAAFPVNVLSPLNLTTVPQERASIMGEYKIDNQHL